MLGGQRHHLHPKHMTGCQTEVKSGQVHSGQPGSQYAAREEELSSALPCEQIPQQVVAPFFTCGQQRHRDIKILARF